VREARERHAGQATLERSSRRGGARAEEDWHGGTGVGSGLAVLARAGARVRVELRLRHTGGSGKM
jgi:hypothetical protein